MYVPRNRANAGSGNSSLETSTDFGRDGNTVAAVAGASKFQPAPKVGAKRDGSLQAIAEPRESCAPQTKSWPQNTVPLHIPPRRNSVGQPPATSSVPKVMPKLVRPPVPKRGALRTPPPVPLQASAAEVGAGRQAGPVPLTASKRPAPPAYPPPGFEVQSKAGAPKSPGQRVVISNFPHDMQSLSSKDLIEHITVQLEAFGKLSTMPSFTPSLSGGRRAVATFEDPEAAQLAIEALNGTVFEIALGTVRRPVQEKAQPERRESERSPGFMTLHIDELEMPLRPEVEPATTDREVWADPLPLDDGELAEIFGAFGELEDVFHVHDPRMIGLADRGYVRFREHAAAEACVRAGAGAWSESERALASQTSQRGVAMRTYPDNIVSVLLGKKGEEITALRTRCGLQRLNIRGTGLGENLESQRLHFLAEGDAAALANLRPELEMRLAAIHGDIRMHLEELGLNWLDDREREWRELREGRLGEGLQGSPLAEPPDVPGGGVPTNESSGLMELGGGGENTALLGPAGDGGGSGAEPPPRKRRRPSPPPPPPGPPVGEGPRKSEGSGPAGPGGREPAESL